MLNHINKILPLFWYISISICLGSTLSFATDNFLTSNDLIFKNKSRLVCGGILPNADLQPKENHKVAAVNTFSEVCTEEDLAVNLYSETNCHLVANVWNFHDILLKNPALGKLRFKEVYFNHISNGFWADHFTQQEREDSITHGSIESDLKKKIIPLFSPLVSVLETDGKLNYQSMVNDWLEEFWEDTFLNFLTKDLLRTLPSIRFERDYPSIAEGRIRLIQRCYILNDVSHPIIKGYLEAFKDLGLRNIEVQFVLSNRSSLENIECKTKPDIDNYLPRAEFYSKNPAYANFKIYDVFLRISGLKS